MLECEMEFLFPVYLIYASGVMNHDLIKYIDQRIVLPSSLAGGGEVSVVQSLLAELPGQFMSYMQTKDIQPLS